MKNKEYPCLVLHFDINKTIVLCDSVCGVTFDHMINAIISECIFGTVEEIAENNSVISSADVSATGQKYVWTLSSPDPVYGPPREGLVSYAEYVENVLKRNRPERKKLKEEFTNEGCPGSLCRPHFDRLVSALDKAAAEAVCYRSLVPAFVMLMQRLLLHHIDFRIIFRTFGTDLTPVVTEYNALVRHLLPDSSRYLITMPMHSASLFRTGDGHADVHLAHLAHDGQVCVYMSMCVTVTS